MYNICNAICKTNCSGMLNINFICGHLLNAQIHNIFHKVLDNTLYNIQYISWKHSFKGSSKHQSHPSTFNSLHCLREFNLLCGKYEVLIRKCIQQCCHYLMFDNVSNNCWRFHSKLSPFINVLYLCILIYYEMKWGITKYFIFNRNNMTKY